MTANWYLDNRVHLATDGGIEPMRGRDAGGAAVNAIAALGAKVWMRHVKLTKVSGPAWPSALPLDGLGQPLLADRPNEVKPLIDAMHEKGIKVVAYFAGWLDTDLQALYPETTYYDQPVSTDKIPYKPIRFPGTEWLDVTAEPIYSITLQRLKELCAMGVDAFSFDEIWMPNIGGYQTATQAAFVAAGGELPTAFDISHKRLKHTRYVAFAGRRLEAALQAWRAEVQQLYPNVLFFMSTTNLPAMIDTTYSTELHGGMDASKNEFQKLYGRVESNVFVPLAETGAPFYGTLEAPPKPPEDVYQAAGYCIQRDISGLTNYPPHLWIRPLFTRLQLQTYAYSYLAYGCVVNMAFQNLYLNPVNLSAERQAIFQEIIALGPLFGSELRRNSAKRFAAVHFAEASRDKRIFTDDALDPLSYVRDRSIVAWQEVLSKVMAAFGFFCRRGMPVAFVTDRQLTNSELTGFRFLFLGNPDELTPEQTAVVAAWEEDGGVVYRAPASGIDWSALAASPGSGSPLAGAIEDLSPDLDIRIISQSTGGRAHVVLHDCKDGGLLIAVLNYFSWPAGIRADELTDLEEDAALMGLDDPPDPPVSVSIEVRVTNPDFVAWDLLTGESIPLTRTTSYLATFTLTNVAVGRFIKIGLRPAGAVPLSAQRHIRAVNFREVLYRIAHRLGIDIDSVEFAKTHVRAWCSSINEHLEQGWRFWPWPEFTVTEERAFRPIWNRRWLFASTDEVFYLPTRSYYKAIADPPVGTLPTDPAYYTPITLADRYIDYDTPCQRSIGEVIGVYASNPRVPGAFPMDFKPSEKGIDLGGYVGGATAFVHYRHKCPQFTCEPHDPTRSYKRGDLIYWSDGEVYRAVTAAGPWQQPSSPVYWVKVLFPQLLAKYVINATCADAAEDEQAKVDFLAMAKASLQFEVDRLFEQGERVSYRMGRRRRFAAPFGVSGFWWSVTAPWSDSGGAAVSTLTDECVDADVSDFGAGRLPSPAPTAGLGGLPSLDLEGLEGGGPNNLDGVDVDAMGLRPMATFLVTIDSNTRIYQLQFGVPGENEIAVLRHGDWRWRRTAS